MTLKRPIFHIALLLIFVAPLLPRSAGAQDSSLTASLYKMDLRSLMNLTVVSASKKEESNFDSPLSLTAISSEEIMKSGATTIEELFRLVPGMIIREEVNGNFDLHIRGNDNVPPGNFSFFSENQLTLVMIDGHKVYNQMNGGTHWETLPIALTDIERIEVIRGPSTALYGPNAVSGVIHIISKRTTEKDGFTGSGNIMAGTQSTTIGNATFGLKKNNLGIRLSGTADIRSRFEDTYYDYTREAYVEADSLHDWQGSGNTVSEGWGDRRFPERDFAKDKKAVNLYARYSLPNDDYVDFSASAQSSIATNVFMETTTTPLTRRKSNTTSFDLKGKFKGFMPQVSYLSGLQNVYVGQRNHEYELQSLDAGIEYEYETSRLTIRPGFIYQWSEYDDRNYRDSETGGLINASQVLSNVGFTLRSDYRPSKRLRFIAALRGDKFQFPDDLYFTYQFISTYNLNEYNLIRAVVSQSNRGPFMADIHTNLETGGILYLGNQSIALPQMKMLELGYRSQISSQFQLDFEAFFTKTTDFIGLELDSATIDLGTFEPNFYYGFRNYPTSSRQLGASATVTFAPSEMLICKAFATVQMTNLTEFEKDTLATFDPFPGMVPASSIPSTDTVAEVVYNGTPRIFGGFSVNSQPTEKIGLWLNGYFYGKQTYTYAYIYPWEARNPEFEIPAKLRLDLKVSYDIWKNNAIFFNARNLLNTRTQEFGFTEKIGGLYLFGLDIKM